MNETKIMFKELLDQRLANKTGKINSSFLFKRLKVKDKELIKILTLWMDELIHQDQVDLIKLGKNKKEETVYMTKDYFLEKIKQHLLSLDFLLDENATFSFFSQMTELQNPNTDLLVSKIQKMLNPLVKFDKGSRNVPIMFNCYRIYVPERMINISDHMVETLKTTSEIVSESKQVKKMMFKAGKTKQRDFTPYQIILTALSYLLLEKGRLILTKDDITQSRGYKVFFNTSNYSTFLDLIRKLYPFSPFISEDLISFYPENWLDISQIQKQIHSKEPEKFLKQNYGFLGEGEISTLLKGLNHDPMPVKKTTLKEKPQANPPGKEKNDPSDSPSVVENKQQDKNTTQNKRSSDPLPLEKNKKPNQKKKKMPKSEPLSFLNEIIHKETENRPSKENNKQEARTLTQKGSSGQKSLIDMIDLFDKNEKHFLSCILDSTKIESGYYSHSEKDQKFKDFVEKISFSDLFTIFSEYGNLILKRALPTSNEVYKDLRNKLENSIMSQEETESDAPVENKVETEENRSEQTQEATDQKPDQPKSDSLLEDLLVSQDSESEANVDDSPQTQKEPSQKSPFIIEDKKEDDKTPDFNLDNVDHESFFKVTNEPEQPKTQKEGPPPVEEKKQTVKKGDRILEKKEERTDDNDDEDYNESELDGKIVSVLTDDQEKWLKIQMLSKTAGFELRDGLAYKPDIAVFDEGFTHLEPIAKNTGAIIMNIDAFLDLLGLGGNR